MCDDPSFEDLMVRLRRGDESAAASIFQRFACRLIGLARSHLDGVIRQKVDPADIMQSAFKSFFRRHSRDEFDLDDWNSLWSLLTVITLRKCGHHIRHYRTAGRDLHREVVPRAHPEEATASWEAIAREPTPSEAAMFAETLERLMARLKDRERTMVELSMQGCSIPEISAAVGRTERTVYRVLERVRSYLEEVQNLEPAGPEPL
jgi:RNA polymerase sigma-70 factor (ECF subfamily)